MRAALQRIRSIIGSAVMGGGGTDASVSVSVADVASAADPASAAGAGADRENAVKGDFQSEINGEFERELKDELKEEFKEELKALEQDLLRYQISTKWELMHRIERLREPAPALTCALCGHTAPAEAFTVFESACIFEGGEITRHQCPQCDVIFGSSLMLSLSAEELTREYEWHYRVFSEGDSTEQELRAFYALKPERDKKYVNWGSGAWSRSIEILRADGWQVFGFEPHGSASGEGEAILRSVDDLIALKPDGIYSNNVLEHLRHPVDELKTMSSLLPPGGMMSHATPCYEYRFEFTRFHLFFFLGRSRAFLADRAGLKTVDYVADGDFMNLLLAKP